MKKRTRYVRDKDLDGVAPALRRAGERARRIAAQTGTPLVIYKDGRVVKMMIKPEKRYLIGNQ